LKYLLTASLIILVFTSVIFSQDELPIFDPTQKKYDTSLEKYYKDRSITKPVVPQILEQELEDKNYTVGPGDLFKVRILGEIDVEFEADVLPEGNILIPKVGDISISGETLFNAKSKIREKVASFYLKSEISINLIRLRKFRVYLTGEVKNPGTYFAQGSDRVSDVIEIADGITDWADDTQIELRHMDGKITFLDLNSFYLYGSKDQNPFLHGGDLIHVRSIDIEERYVIVEGNSTIATKLEGEENQTGQTNLLGIYPIRAAEKLNDFLLRIGALSKRSNLENITIERDSTIIHINLLNPDDPNLNLIMKHRDKIYIPPLQDRVYVRGEVLTPGPLAYYANYKAIDYVGMAGALDSSAEPDEYVVIRIKNGETVQGGNVVVHKGDTILVPKRGREVFKDLFVIITPAVSLLLSAIILFK